jgi:hypothetical protein
MAKKGKAKARKRVETKDLASRDPKQVKGGGQAAGFIPGAGVISNAISSQGSVKSSR